MPYPSAEPRKSFQQAQPALRWLLEGGGIVQFGNLVTGYNSLGCAFPENATQTSSCLACLLVDSPERVAKFKNASSQAPAQSRR